MDGSGRGGAVAEQTRLPLPKGKDAALVASAVAGIRPGNGPGEVRTDTRPGEATDDEAPAAADRAAATLQSVTRRAPHDPTQ
jgi:hypothetical protein